MIIPTEQLLNISGIRVLSVRVEAHSIQCEIESSQGYSMCHRCGQKPWNFTATTRHWNCLTCLCVVGP
jgi:hypothetical protein